MENNEQAKITKELSTNIMNQVSGGTVASDNSDSDKRAFINNNLCRNCRACLGCHTGAIYYTSVLTMRYYVNIDACDGCGECVSVCPHGAISMD